MPCATVILTRYHRRLRRFLHNQDSVIGATSPRPRSSSFHFPPREHRRLDTENIKITSVRENEHNFTTDTTRVCVNIAQQDTSCCKESISHAKAIINVVIVLLYSA